MFKQKHTVVWITLQATIKGNKLYREVSKLFFSSGAVPFLPSVNICRFQHRSDIFLLHVASYQNVFVDHTPEIKISLIHYFYLTHKLLERK